MPSICSRRIEEDWSNLSGNIAPYQKSKTPSERAAWDFITRAGGGLELAAVNPVPIMGPALGVDSSHSISIVKRLMDGQPGCPKINSCHVDACDVAYLHLRAMTDPAAKGERFLAIAGESLWTIDVAKILRKRLDARAAKVPTLEIPNWLVRFLARNIRTLQMMVPLLGVNMNASSEKAIRLLGWRPRSAEDAIVATAESLIALGAV